MATPESKLVYTVEDYLAIERATDERHEYLDGQIYAMAGESPAHGDICTNLTREISIQLKSTPCRVWSKDCKVRSGPAPLVRRSTKGLYSYPDLVIVCGEPEFHDKHQDVLINPKVIIEVLSASTEAFDSNEKLRRYQFWNPTLTDYLLVSQTEPVVYHYLRQTDSGWSYHVYQGLAESVHVQAIGCTLRMAEVYDRIVFSADEDELPGEYQAG
jgi:Uma2 family endonuclease